VADSRRDIVLDEQLISVSCGGADIGLGIEVIPNFEPRVPSVVVSVDRVDALSVLDSFL